MMKPSQVEVGKRVWARLDQEPWMINEISGPRVKLIRTCQEKWLLKLSLCATYTLIGSPGDLLSREAFKRHGWKVWGDDESISG